MFEDLKLSQTLLRPPSFAISSGWSSSSTDKVYSAGLFTNGLWIHSFPVRGSFVVGKQCSNSLESWYRWSCTSWEKEGPGSVSFKISANVWNMSKVPMFTRHPYNSSLALNAATSSADLNTVVILPWSDRLNSLSRLSMSHK